MEPINASVAILTADFFEESEVIFPYFRLLGAVRKVIVTTPDGGPARGKGGLEQFAAQSTFAQLSVDDFDAVVIPGGFAPDIVRRSAEALDFLRQMDHAGKPVAMICHGAWVALSAGILEGRKVTGAPFIRPEIEGAGAQWFDEPVIIDGNLVTSRLPRDLDPWMNAFLDLLSTRVQSLASAGSAVEGVSS
ncbi:hypothetical protein BLJ79_17760 [Arthrobacter sp. UCD-GKA]|uniref:type 1 glutamine amidotransferase domain-containing protein n=1 Tax=Arthrobacter sp. UCD-GKA TaxID=1913576 RepID=UPI0008DDA7EF|nr:type 1 glutamine amidotransferase domain-containing protein [Arthrobacter sp. UCD-GKA]OIH82798.1 hypothetical protein BLJ79_17760 [Arthrobacter sp. UCD-GKA]